MAVVKYEKAGKPISNKINEHLFDALDRFCDETGHNKQDAIAAGLVLFMTSPLVVRQAAIAVSKTLVEPVENDELSEFMDGAVDKAKALDDKRAHASNRLFRTSDGRKPATAR